jgi:hypothetical protein
MIIDKIVRVKVNNRYLCFYKKLGFGKLKQGDYINLPIEYLPKSSNLEVKVECDYCLGIFIRKYRLYNDVISRGELYCCKSCRPKKYRDTCLMKYGVSNTTKLESVKSSIKKSCIEKYGVESYSMLDSFKEAHKIKMLEKYGVDSFSKTSEWLDKQKNTCLLKYGVENASQCPNIFSKQQKSRFEINNFNNTDIFYQGTYEHDFLEKYYNTYKIEKATPIEYFYDGSIRVYYPDFFLPEYNLIVEIKSTYTFEKYLNKNTAKKEKCIKLGFNFIFIIDKDYKEFEYFINSTI